MHWLDYLQWPAMLVTVVAAWLVASAHRRRRQVGFWGVPRQQPAVDRLGACTPRPMR
ncbi:amino acid transporter [Pseudomonas aeruginosa]|nr:amino acid transporter [Pseudomonas aeruginosa]